MIARIHKKIPNAMQSGKKDSEEWIIEFPGESELRIDPLTGSTSMCDTSRELDLSFPDQQSAIGYAKSNGIAFELIAPANHNPIPRSYADNFAYNRKFPWTH